MPGGSLFRNRFRIPSTRLKSWDYRWAAAYYVTLCTRLRICWLGEIVKGEALLSPLGQVVAEEWRKIPRARPWVILDEWIIMPDHIHGILIFQNNLPKDEPAPTAVPHLLAQSLGAVIGQSKAGSTKRIWWNMKQTRFAWQARYHDIILREPADLERARTYIRENPLRWMSKAEGNPT
jgi:putative transposase